PPVQADVVILAGDISVGTRGVAWAREWADGRPVLYVVGNHELYGHSLPALIDEMRESAAGSSIHVLENDELIVDGVRFLGCTLWSDFEFDGAERRAAAMLLSARVVNDYGQIRTDGRGLRPGDPPPYSPAEPSLARDATRTDPPGSDRRRDPPRTIDPLASVIADATGPGWGVRQRRDAADGRRPRG